MESILTSIKKMLGIAESIEHFDQDLIIHINSVFTILTNDLGVGSSEGFYITDKEDTWQDFIPNNIKKIEAIKTFIYLKVKLIFDPPDRANVLDSMERQIKEYEWRICNWGDSINFEEV